MQYKQVQYHVFLAFMPVRANAETLTESLRGKNATVQYFSIDIQEL